MNWPSRRNSRELSARYEWTLASGLTAHVTPNLSYSDESFSDVITINRDKMDSWALVGLTAGVTNGRWSVDLYGENLFDEKAAELSRNYVNDESGSPSPGPSPWVCGPPSICKLRLRVGPLSAPFFGALFV
jgi:outer membrane receptor protein involved in Fe transport